MTLPTCELVSVEFRKQFLSFLFLSLATCSLLVSQAQDESKFGNLKRLFSEKKLEIDAEAAQKKAALLGRYGEALEGIQKEFQSSGDLENVILVKAEMEAAKAGDLAEEKADSKFPESVQKLRAVAEDEIESILEARTSELSSLRGKYITALEGLKVTETKSGNLESAISISAEIERIRTLVSSSKAKRVRTLEDIPEPLREGLVAWFPLDEDGDLVVNGSSSRELKGALEGTSYVPEGKVGGARSFNGSSDRIKLGNQIPDSEELTISLWVRSRNTPGSGGLFSDFTGANGNDLMLALIGNSQLAIRADKSKRKLRTSVDLPKPLSDEWHHIAWVMDSASSTVYLDGKKFERVRTEGSNTGFHGAFLGFANDGNSWTYFHGEIDEFMMWDKPLNDRDIQTIFGLFP